MGRGRSSLVIFLLRQFAITLPLAWLLAGPMGLAGIWCSFIVAEVAAAAAAGLMLGQLFRRDPVLCRRCLLYTSVLPQAHRAAENPGGAGQERKNFSLCKNFSFF